jgi:hypothetical protein
MTKYYLEVASDKLSICLDTDINYYHHFKLGDLLLIEFGLDTVLLKFGHMTIKNPEFTENWDSIKSSILSISSCVSSGRLVDVSLQVERQDKLKQLGL